jgi:hypothetical protein
VTPRRRGSGLEVRRGFPRRRDGGAPRSRSSAPTADRSSSWSRPRGRHRRPPRRRPRSSPASRGGLHRLPPSCAATATSRGLVRGGGAKRLSPRPTPRPASTGDRARWRLADLSSRASDTLVARGERARRAVVAAALTRQAGAPSGWTPPRSSPTDGRHGAAAPTSRRRGERPAAPPAALEARGDAGRAGFLGAGPDGTVDLGRGGSDLTATLLARSLSASRVVLWKDVPASSPPTPAPCRRASPSPDHHREAAGGLLRREGPHPRAPHPLDGSSMSPHVARSSTRAPGHGVSARQTLAAYREGPRHDPRAGARHGGGRA